MTTISWDQRLAPFHLDAARRWRTLAILGWVIVCVVIIGIFVAKPDKVTGFAPYLKGASRWLDGFDLYSNKPNKGFVYSPLAAVFFSPFTFVHPAVANVTWRLLSAACLVGGLWSMVRFGPFDRIPAHLRGLVFLLLIPLSLSNIDSGQANPIVIGLVMAGSPPPAGGIDIGRPGDCRRRALENLSGRCRTAAHGDLSVEILLAVHPHSRRHGCSALPLSKERLRDRAIREWVSTRFADNRFQYSFEIAPLDLWFVLVRVFGLPLSEVGYHLLRGITGAAIAGFCFWGRLRGWQPERLYGGLFAFACAWMVLLGPASEWLTYLLLAPAAALAVVEVFTFPARLWIRVTALLAYGILLLAVLRVGFVPKLQTPWLLALQPIGALCYVAFAVQRYAALEAKRNGLKVRRHGAIAVFIRAMNRSEL